MGLTSSSSSSSSSTLKDTILFSPPPLQSELLKRTQMGIKERINEEEFEKVFEKLINDSDLPNQEKILYFENLKENYETMLGKSVFPTPPILVSLSKKTNHAPFSKLTDERIKKSYVDVCKTSNRQNLIRNIESSGLPEKFETMNFEKLLEFINLDHLIAAGNYGAVFLGTIKSTNQKVAIKIMQSTSLLMENMYKNPYFYFEDDSFLIESTISMLCSKLPVDFFSVASPFYQVTSCDIETTDPTVTSLVKLSLYLDSSIVIFLEPFEETVRKRVFKMDKSAKSLVLHVQSLYAMYYFQKYLRACHFDLHGENIMVVDCDSIIPTRVYPFANNNKKLVIDSSFRLCLMDFGYAMSDVFFGDDSCWKAYQTRQNHMSFFIKYVLPMNTFDVFKFMDSCRTQEQIDTVLNYIRFRYYMLYYKLTTRIATPTYKVGGALIGDDLHQSDDAIKTMNDFFIRARYLPIEFMCHSHQLLEYLMEKFIDTIPGMNAHAKILNTTSDYVQSLRRRASSSSSSSAREIGGTSRKRQREGPFQESSERVRTETTSESLKDTVYESFAMKNENDFDYSKSVRDQLDEMTRRSVFPKNPIQVVYINYWEKFKKQLVQEVLEKFEDPQFIDSSIIEQYLYSTLEEYGYPTLINGVIDFNGTLALSVLIFLKDSSLKAGDSKNLKLNKIFFGGDVALDQMIIYFKYFKESIHDRFKIEKIVQKEDELYFKHLSETASKERYSMSMTPVDILKVFNESRDYVSSLTDDQIKNRIVVKL